MDLNLLESADLEPILAICDRYNIPLVEDAAEALGANFGTSKRWLSCLTIDPKTSGTNREQIRLQLLEKIETRPIWKPMHLQPIFADCEYINNGVAEELF